MKKVLAMILVAANAYAEEPVPPAPPPEQPAPEQPPSDPAYGQRPDRYDPADGGGNYFAAPKGKDIYIKQYPDRSRTNVIALWSTVGVGVLFGGVGLAFHLDYRSKADDLASDRFTGDTWTDARQQTFDDAHRSSVYAGVFYGIGGATLLAATVAFIVTEP